MMRDLVHAARSLARAPGFTVVCVTSLSIGMAAAIAIPYFARLLFAAPAGVNTAGLIELLITPRGPLRIELGEAAVEGWSYPDYADLRDAETGMMVSAPVALSYAQRHSDTALWVKVVDYLGETYTARPSDASDYVFFAGDVISLRIEVVNRGSEAITHDDARGGAGPAQSFSFDTPSEVRASIGSSVRLQRLGAEVAGAWSDQMLLDRNQALVFDAQLQIHSAVPKDYVVNIRTDLRDTTGRPVAPQAPRVQFEMRASTGATAEQARRQA